MTPVGVHYDSIMATTRTLPCGRVIQKNKNEISEDQWLSSLQEFLKTKNLKNSEPRLAVAKTILSMGGHFRTQELADAVQKKFKDVATATVYRAVSLFLEGGLIKESIIREESGESVYEISGEHHHDHIVCLDCHEIFEFHSDEIEDIQNKICKTSGFRAENHRHVIYARCDKL